MFNTTLATPTIIRRKIVESITGLSRSSIYAAMSQGRFPQPVKLGARAVGWRHADIVQWVNTRQERT